MRFPVLKREMSFPVLISEGLENVDRDGLFDKEKNLDDFLPESRNRVTDVFVNISNVIDFFKEDLDLAFKNKDKKYQSNPYQLGIEDAVSFGLTGKIKTKDSNGLIIKNSFSFEEKYKIRDRYLLVKTYLLLYKASDAPIFSTLGPRFQNNFAMFLLLIECEIEGMMPESQKEKVTPKNVTTLLSVEEPFENYFVKIKDLISSVLNDCHVKKEELTSSNARRSPWEKLHVSIIEIKSLVEIELAKKSINFTDADNFHRSLKGCLYGNDSAYTRLTDLGRFCQEGAPVLKILNGDFIDKKGNDFTEFNKAIKKCEEGISWRTADNARASAAAAALQNVNSEKKVLAVNARASAAAHRTLTPNVKRKLAQVGLLLSMAVCITGIVMSTGVLAVPLVMLWVGHSAVITGLLGARLSADGLMIRKKSPEKLENSSASKDGSANGEEVLKMNC